MGDFYGYKNLVKAKMQKCILTPKETYQKHQMFIF